MLENQEKNIKSTIKQKKKKKRFQPVWLNFYEKILSCFYITKRKLQNYYFPKLKSKIDS